MCPKHSYFVFFFGLFWWIRNMWVLLRIKCALWWPNQSAACTYASLCLVCSSLDLSELAKAAKKKLQSVSIFVRPSYPSLLFSHPVKCNFLTVVQLSNHLFEELAMDVYDEVDRRETDAGRVKVSSEFGVLQLELLHCCCSDAHLSAWRHRPHSLQYYS